MSLINLIDLPSLGDERGSLVAIEAIADVPFDIKRVYYIFSTQHGTSRGYHAHKNLQQLAICVAGKCQFLLNDGAKIQSVWLDDPKKGLLIAGNTWREMHNFSIDCVLLVLASDYFDELDYIRDYDSFLEWVKK